MPTGEVVFFNNDRGYGFIEPDDGGDDVFVHISAVFKAKMDTLYRGRRVSYELTLDKRKGRMIADDLKLA